MALALVAVFATSAERAYDRRVDEHIHVVVSVSRALFMAMQTIRFERSTANSGLEAAGPIDQGTQHDAIAALRASSNAALDKALTEGYEGAMSMPVSDAGLAVAIRDENSMVSECQHRCCHVVAEEPAPADQRSRVAAGGGLGWIRSMRLSERQRIPDVGRSATALAERVRNLALALADIDRSAAAGGSEALEAEISRLENAANPLDQSGSDERVRRLAFLKRQRRAIAEVSAKRGSIAAKLETCLVALQNIKLDLIRLNAGSQTPQHITSLAMDALNLADSVDTALYVADEMRTTGSKQARPSAAR